MTINPWNVQPPPKVGDASRDTTFRAVGAALTAWEEFETQLSMIFAAILGARLVGRLAAQRAYGSIQSFLGRLDMIDHAMTVYLDMVPDDPLKANLTAQWGSLYSEAKEYGARRNEIAHGIVSRYVANPANRLPDMTWGWVVHPAYYNSKKQTLLSSSGEQSWTTPKYFYSSVEVEIYRKGFIGLAPRAGLIAVEIQRTQAARLVFRVQPA